MKKTNYVKDVLIVLLGNFMVAVSVAFFVLPNKAVAAIYSICMAYQYIDDRTLYCWCYFFRKGICLEIIDFYI